MPRTWVAWGAWLVRGLLALPVQYQVIDARLIFYLHREKLPRLHLALLSSKFAQASTNPNHTGEMLKFQQTGAGNIKEAFCN